MLHLYRVQQGVLGVQGNNAELAAQGSPTLAFGLSKRTVRQAGTGSS